MRTVKSAAVQLSPVLYSREGTVDKVVKKIHELGQEGVQFATFPETVVPYYPYFSFLQAPYQIIAGREHLKLLDQAVTVPSPATNAISDASKEAGVVVSIGVNERDGGTLYNTQLLVDADGTLIQRRRKTTPTYHERMVWGQGDGSGLRAVDSKVGRIGQLACWEHYNPLARYAMMADGEQIHSAMYPGSIFGRLFAEQTEINIRQHALESACFVVCATAWLNADQQAQIVKDTGTAASAARSSWEDGRALAAALASGQAPPPVSVPVGFTTFPGEIRAAPRSWVETVYPGLAYFNEVDRGGHFAAWEEPELFSEEVRAAFKSLR